jgi:hypothetical protein
MLIASSVIILLIFLSQLLSFMVGSFRKVRTVSALRPAFVLAGTSVQNLAFAPQSFSPPLLLAALSVVCLR